MKTTAPKQSIQSDTANRLRNYGVFSDSTINFIAAFADTQRKYKTYQEVFEAANIPEPTLYRTKNGRGVPVVDIVPFTKKVDGVLVLHLPMVNPLDQNQLYHIATIALMHPRYRIIAFGNPSGAPYHFKEQNKSLKDLFLIACTNRLYPLVSVELDYLKSQNIQNAHHIGYSFGAHKAVIETLYADPIEVASLTVIDPVAHPRGLKQLVHDFKSTFQPMGAYVDRTHMQTYFDARADAAKTQHHNAGLFRPISIAIGLLLGRVDFITLVKKATARNPQMVTTVAWGSDGELGNDAHMTVSMHQLRYELFHDVLPLRLKGDKHSLANDIFLYAAIVHEALLKTAAVDKKT